MRKRMVNATVRASHLHFMSLVDDGGGAPSCGLWGVLTLNTPLYKSVLCLYASIALDVYAVDDDLC